ncbi:MAG: NAD-dependent deacetylase [Magnetococcales bacterium]|nr:NAD-dependent deacetylase [Magnetococcales bacterium]
MKYEISTQTSLLKAARAIAGADSLLITSGAGMGVDSGLPDFRGKAGFWREYPAIANMGIAFEEMANPQWFDTDPYLAWAFYGHRLNLYRNTVPHLGFQQLLDIASNRPYGYHVMTSNVDGQFQLAGFNAKQIMECHGSIHYLQCTQGCGSGIWSGEGVEVEVDEVEFKAVGDLPLCSCGELARPNILMFGDWGWNGERSGEQEKRLQSWLNNLRNEGAKLVIIEIGAGHSVPTIRMSSERFADILNAVLIRINPRDFSVPQPHISLPLGGLEGITAIVDLL